MGRFERRLARERLTQCMCAESDAVAVAFGVAAAMSLAAMTSTSGRGVNGGEGMFAVAGAYLSFQ